MIVRVVVLRQTDYNCGRGGGSTDIYGGVTGGRLIMNVVVSGSRLTVQAAVLVAAD